MNRRGLGFFLLLIAGSFLCLQSLFADYKQAVAYWNQQRYDKAIQELKPDLDSNPDWEFGHRLMGLCYLNLKNNALAVSSLVRAVQLKSTAYATYQGLGQAYFNMQQWDKAVQILSQGEPFIKGPTEATDRYNLHHLRGSAQFRLDKFSEAANDLTAALKLKQNDWADYSQLGSAFYSLKRYDEAIQTFQKALSLKPGHGATTELLGKSYFKKGVDALTAKQYDAAIEQLRKAREFNPKDGFAAYNIAEAYLFKQNYVEAEKALNQALEAMPRSAEVFMRLGLVYEKQKKWDLALTAYHKANDLSPTPGLNEAIDRVSQNKKP